MKQVFIIIAIIVSEFCLNHFTLRAQETTGQMAFGGPSGIFINTGVDLLSALHPSGNAVGYIIERKSEDDKNWQKIIQLSSPDSYNEFLINLTHWNRLLKDSIPLAEIPLTVIWDKAQKHRRLDSLRYLGNPLVVRLALGVCYLDRDVLKSKTCHYKVSTIDLAGRELESFITNPVSFPPPAEKSGIVFESKEAYENNIKISWNIPEGTRAARFRVFRQSGLAGDFAEIRPAKYFQNKAGKNLIAIMDTLVEKSHVYQYFITPVDYYQNAGLPGDTVMAAAYNFSSIIPPYRISVTGLDSVGALKLTWHLDHANDILSLKIFRSTESDKNFSEIAEVRGSDSAYIDRTAEPLVKYYYYLLLNDPFGDVSLQSAKVFGLYKSAEIPMPPLSLRGEVVDGGVKLTWEKSENYVNVYHIYRGLSEFPELTLINNLKSSESLVEYIDTSSYLKGNVAYSYSVRSENTSGNMSGFTDTISIVPGIKTLLRAPLQLRGYEENQKVYLYWENVFKTDPTLDGYKVFRKTGSGENQAAEIYEAVSDTLISAKQNNFVDTTVTGGNNYEYAVKAYDIYGNESALSPAIKIQIRAIPVPAPAGIMAVSTVEGILVSWQPPLESVNGYRVFRYERGEYPQLVGLIKGNIQSEYLDQNVQSGNLYFYFVKSVGESNQLSDPSEETGIRK